MKTNKIIPVIFSLVMLNCAGSLTSMKEPSEGKNLIIGSVIFENNGYQNRNDVYFSNLEVAIIGIYNEDGNEKVYGKLVFTDKNGYFFIPNVPDGRYAVKGIRVNLAGQAYLTITNEFRTAVDNYQIQPTENIVYSGTLFDNRPNNRVINLKHNYFTIHPNSEIRYGAYDKIEEFKASNGELLSRPLIYESFIKKYPESGWNKYLQEIIEGIKK